MNVYGTLSNMISKRVVSGRWMLELFLLSWSEYWSGHEKSHIRDGRKLWSNVIKNDPKST